MNRYRLTVQARADLLDIFIYGREQFGDAQADSYAAGLDRLFQLLAEHPGLGRKADAFRSGARRHE